MNQEGNNWEFKKQEISDLIWHFTYYDTANPDTPLTFRQVVENWITNTAFCGFHNQVLSNVPFKAYKWETPVVDVDRFDRPFEFVVLNSPGLDRKENSTPFKQQFKAAGTENAIIQFDNIGRNAVLVVPIPCGANVNHCHLTSFLSTCRAEEETELWRTVGTAMQQRVSNKPVWLSTAGGGVAWLHVRLDDRPKYYGYQPFKQA